MHKFRSIVLHTATRDFMYEFKIPLTKHAWQKLLSEAVKESSVWVSFSTTEGETIFRLDAIVGFDLEDQV